MEVAPGRRLRRCAQSYRELRIRSRNEGAEGVSCQSYQRRAAKGSRKRKCDPLQHTSDGDIEENGRLSAWPAPACKLNVVATLSGETKRGGDYGDRGG